MEVTVTGISDGKLTYIDAKGIEKSIQADNVVISAGRKPRQDEAMKFSGVTERFFIIGDCRKAATLWNSIRNAFATASQI
jgi:NADH dehydrogenase FAD-containing subunit